MAGLAQMEDTYAFEMFESSPGRFRTYGAAQASAAPERREEEREAPVLKKINPKTYAQKRREERSGNVRIAFMLAFVAVVFGVICCQISAGAERYELIRQIAAVESEIEVARSENVRLNAELNSKTNITKIDSYAVDVLGMVKVESYQVECIDLTKGDRVLYSNNTK
jgi:cell division protein FtsL